MYGMEVIHKFENYEIAVLCMKETHPNLLNACDMLRGENALYVVMPSMNTDWFRLVGSKLHLFTEITVRSVMRQILHGLDHLHERGIVHCDFKSSNIMYDVEGENVSVRIGDFGSTSILNNEEYAHHTELRTTYQYCAPEQTYGQSYKSKADIFAAGSIMYELCTGKLAFSGRWKSSIFRAFQCEIKPQLPAEFSEDAKDLYKSLYADDPNSRPSAAEALKHDWFQDSLPVTSCVGWSKIAIASLAARWF